MAYNLKTEKKIMAVSALCEGSSIRSIERMTGIHRDTIMRLGVRVGHACASMLDARMRNLELGSVQIDEVWAFVKKRKGNKKKYDPQWMGDAYTFFAMDRDTKLIPCYRIGKRSAITVDKFLKDLSERLINTPQINSDGMQTYLAAIERNFGPDVDYGQVVKTYVAAKGPEAFAGRKYTAQRVERVEKYRMLGEPAWNSITTSHIERQHLTARTLNKRMQRLTLAFSKKLDNFKASVGLYTAYYDFCKKHGTLKATPAQAYGMESRQWTVADLVALSES